MIVAHVSSVASLKIRRRIRILYYADHVPLLVFFSIFSLPDRSLYPSSRSRRGCQISPSFRTRKISTPDTGFIGLHRGNKGWSANQDRTNISWYKIIIYRKYLFDEWKNVEDNLIVLPDFENKNSASFFFNENLEKFSRYSKRMKFFYPIEMDLYCEIRSIL